MKTSKKYKRRNYSYKIKEGEYFKLVTKEEKEKLRIKSYKFIL